MATLKRTIRPIYFKRGYNIQCAETFRNALYVPIASVGSPDMAGEIISGLVMTKRLDVDTWEEYLKLKEQ